MMWTLRRDLALSLLVFPLIVGLGETESRAWKLIGSDVQSFGKQRLPVEGPVLPGVVKFAQVVTAR